MVGTNTFFEQLRLLLWRREAHALSFISWEGRTTFQQTYIIAALEDGGAFQAETSQVKWKGNASFIGNRGGKGGALHLDEGATVFWEGETIFRDNVVDLAGGALYLSGASTASWEQAVTTLQNNTNFLAEGGAIYLWRESTIIFGGVAYIRNNKAVASGGALYAGDEANIYFTANSTTVFEDNECDTTGGAVALSTITTFLELNHITAKLTFIGNSAGIAGGAVYHTGIPSGLSFLGVTFTSNSAPIGGAVYSLASGTATGIQHILPKTSYVDCHFHGNTATTSGGAVESAAGRDLFATSYLKATQQEA